jgi:hypothetical protein
VITGSITEVIGDWPWMKIPQRKNFLRYLILKY